MNLTELKGYRTSDAYALLKRANSSYHPYKEALELFEHFTEAAQKSGWILKGSGAFGAVFWKAGKPYVYKVFFDPDTAYRTYIEWCLKNQHNPFVPKVGKIIKVPGTDIFINKIELLTRADDNVSAVKKYIDYDYLENVDKDSPFWRRSGMYVSSLEKALVSLYKNNRDFRDLIDHLKEDWNFDVHWGNYMLRGEQLVVIDPIAYRRFKGN
jgi:hypothetical protein